MSYELCTDRTLRDMTILLRLYTKGMTEWDTTDWKLWTGEWGVFYDSSGQMYEASDGTIYVSGQVNGVNTNRGAWNYTDINRVRAVMLDIVDRLDELGYAFAFPYSLIPAQTAASVPNTYTINTRLLANLLALRNAVGTSPAPPTSGNNMTYREANQTEKCLEAMDNRIACIEYGSRERWCGIELCGGDLI